MADRVRVYVDGGARGNPGPAGAGARITDDRGRVLREISEPLPPTTNNVAEYRAAIAGLEAALDLGARDVTLLADSDLLVKQLTGRYRVKSPGLQPLHAHARRLLARFASAEVVQIPREQNAAADRLANQAMDRAGRGGDGARAPAPASIFAAGAGVRERLAPYVSNPLDATAGRARWVAAVIGAHVSSYSLSPGLWRRAAAAFGLDLAYLALDVAPPGLAGLVSALRTLPGLLGFNVTVPFKEAIVPLLDRLDEAAAGAGSVNTVVREGDRLVGRSTDGAGLADALRRGPAPLAPDLDGRAVVLLGAGGAARASGAALAECGAAVRVVNRDPGRAGALAARLGARAFIEDRIAAALDGAALVVNATTKGQAGWQALPDGRVTCLEPYSALAPASPAAVDTALAEPDRRREWHARSHADIEANLHLSHRALAALPADARAFDLVYAPRETVLLRQFRWSGRRAQNGEAMLRWQAAHAFVLVAGPALARAPEVEEVERAMRDGTRDPGLGTR